MGDNYRGFAFVGTLPDMLTRSEYADGKRFRVRSPGRVFDMALREAVVGSFVAQKLGLKRGDKFHPYHGLNFDEKKVHEEEYVVVGILEPSNTPADRVLWIPLEGVQKMTGHAVEAAEQISAVLVRLRNPIAGPNARHANQPQGHAPDIRLAYRDSDVRSPWQNQLVRPSARPGRLSCGRGRCRFDSRQHLQFDE
jgi:putative ABC transport system permease protein